MKEAFYYIFKDFKGFLSKTTPILLLITLSLFIKNFILVFAMFGILTIPETTASIWAIVLNLLYILILCIPSGYLLKCIKTFAEQKEFFELPIVEYGKDFVKGVKLALALGLSYFVFISLSSILYMLLGLSAIFVPTTYGLQNVCNILILIVFIAMVAIFVAYLMVFMFMFAFKSNLLTFFRYVAGTKMYLFDVKTYFKGFGLLVLIFLVETLISNLLTINPLLLKNFLFYCLVSFIMSMVAIYVFFTEAGIISKALKLESLNVIKIGKNEISEEVSE